MGDAGLVTDHDFRSTLIIQKIGFPEETCGVLSTHHIYSEKEITMAGPIVFISHFKIKEGRSESSMELTQKVVELIKENKSGTVAFLNYTNLEGTELSIIHVFPDADSFDRHIEGVDERVKTAMEFIEPTRREIYGIPHDQVMEMLRPPNGSGITFQSIPRLAGGFIRLQPE